jgi:hypothetical protein
MLMRKFAATSALVIAALGVTAGTVNAAPAPETAVNFTAESTESSTIITTDAGSLVVEDNTFKVKASNGTVLAGTPLSFRVDDFEFPIAADISGRTATLTPQLDMAKAVYKPVALPFEDQANWKSPYDREKDAFNRMKDTISTGATIATLVGGIAGATVASATIIGLFGPFIPAAAVGCIGGILAVGALGTLAGQILITAPVAIGAAIQYFTTINQPFNPPAK